jgi:DinB family protein
MQANESLPLSRAVLLDTLRATARELPSLVASIDTELLRWRPTPGKWSILEILCHMRDMEREAYLCRYRRILAEDRPALPDIDGDAYAIENDYMGEDAATVVADWSRLREEALAVLSRVREAEFGRTGIHEGLGVLTIDDYLKRHAIGNDEAHLGQIRAIVERKSLFARLETGPGRLAAALSGLTNRQLRERPAPSSWAPIEIACHLRDVERVFAVRFSKIAFSERPQLFRLDNDRTAARRRYIQEDPASACGDFRRFRADTLALLHALPQAVWTRTGMHPTRGEVSIADVGAILAGHDDGHLARIVEITRRDDKA